MQAQVQTIIFVTGNSSKFQEVDYWIKEFSDGMIKLESADLDIPEHQTLDIYHVALQKALFAWELLRKPLLIDDGGIFLEKFNMFPGTLSKFVYQGIGLEGVWQLAKDDPRCYFLAVLGYRDSLQSYHFFEGKTEGHIQAPPKVITHHDMPFTEFFIPRGSTKTLAQIKDEQLEFKDHHRQKAVKAFVEWFKKHRLKF